MKILITSGGTIAPIDSVRHVANMSTGRFGSEIGTAVLSRSCPYALTYLHAKGSHAPHNVVIDVRKDDMRFELSRLAERSMLPAFRNPALWGYEAVEYKTFAEYQAHLMAKLSERKPDVVFLAAAVSDYAPTPETGKMSSNSDELIVRMNRLPKVINTVKEVLPSTHLVGFKLLANSGAGERDEAAHRQMKEAKSDVVVVNDINDLRQGRHRLWVYSTHSCVLLTGNDLAAALLELVINWKTT